MTVYLFGILVVIRRLLRRYAPRKILFHPLKSGYLYFLLLFFLHFLLFTFFLPYSPTHPLTYSPLPSSTFDFFSSLISHRSSLSFSSSFCPPPTAFCLPTPSFFTHLSPLISFLLSFLLTTYYLLLTSYFFSFFLPLPHTSWSIF